MIAVLPLVALVWLFSVGRVAGHTAFGVATVGVLFLALLVSTWTDMTQRKIFNWVTYPTFFFGVGLNLIGTVVAASTGVSFDPPLTADVESVAWWQRLGVVGLASSLLGAAVCFFALLVAYRLSGNGGAGDVKLATAIGSLVGATIGISVVLYTYVIAGVVLASWLVIVAGPFRVVGHLVRGVGHHLLPMWVAPPREADFLRLLGRPVPMAVFFLFGTITALFLKG